MSRRFVRRAKELKRSLPITAALMVALPALSKAEDRGMWLWKADSAIQNLGNARSTLFAFCAAPHGTTAISPFTGAAKPVNVLYLYCHAYINGNSTQLSQLRGFLSAAHSAGLKVHYLDGAPDWATTGKAYAESYLNYALSFNTHSTSAAEKFDGIQYDVEPYLLTGWFSQTIWDSFAGLLTDCENAVKASQQGIPFGVCIPRWYDVTPGTSYLSQVQQITDYVAVMDYVNTVAGLVADAQTEISNAAQLGKKVVLGVETMNVTPSTSTFNAFGYGNMEIALDSLALAYSTSSAFAGNAVHYYDYYAPMTEWGTVGAPSVLPGSTTTSTTTTVTTSGSTPTTTTTTSGTTTLKKRKH
jgi:hypothetical protein